MKTTKNRSGSCKYSPLTVTDKLYGRSSIFGFFEAALLPKQLRETNEIVLYNFDVSRILETWKFRQERGLTGFVWARVTNTAVLRFTNVSSYARSRATNTALALIL
jgi:hypothetical protein